MEVSNIQSDRSFVVQNTDVTFRHALYLIRYKLLPVATDRLARCQTQR